LGSTSTGKKLTKIKEEGIKIAGRGLLKHVSKYIGPGGQCHLILGKWQTRKKQEKGEGDPMN